MHPRNDMADIELRLYRLNYIPFMTNIFTSMKSSYDMCPPGGQLRKSSVVEEEIVSVILVCKPNHVSTPSTLVFAIPNPHDLGSLWKGDRGPKCTKWKNTEDRNNNLWFSNSESSSHPQTVALTLIAFHVFRVTARDVLLAGDRIIIVITCCYIFSGDIEVRLTSNWGRTSSWYFKKTVTE